MTLGRRQTTIGAGLIATLFMSVAASGEDFADRELRVAIDDGSDDKLLFVTLKQDQPQRTPACTEAHSASPDRAARPRKPVISKEISATN